MSTMNDEKLHLIVSTYFLADTKANRSIKEADEMATKLLSAREQQIALEARIDEMEATHKLMESSDALTAAEMRGRIKYRNSELSNLTQPHKGVRS